MVNEAHTKVFRKHFAILGYYDLRNIGVNQRVLTNDECEKVVSNLMKEAEEAHPLSNDRILHVTCTSYSDNDKNCKIHSLPKSVVDAISSQHNKSNNAWLYAGGVATGMFIFSLLAKK